MTRVRVAKATLVDPLALQVKLELIQSDRVAKKPSFLRLNMKIINDEYTRFDTGSKARPNLVLTQGMGEYLSDKFTHYVKDKTIQESVLDSNSLPEGNCLNTPRVDDYLGEIFESLNKSFGKEI